MAKMRAIVIREPGGPEVLEMEKIRTREPGRREIRVRVRAAGVNRADLLQRRGLYPPPPGWPAEVPGLEYAGEVEAVGEAVELWKPGDRVMGLVGGGGYAEYVVVQEREALAIPPLLSFEEAAAVPEVFITAHDALFSQMRLELGERLLIHAVGSGVGSAALQLAKAAGATVIGTSRAEWKLDRATDYGLDVLINTSEQDFPEMVNQATAGQGVRRRSTSVRSCASGCASSARLCAFGRWRRRSRRFGHSITTWALCSRPVGSAPSSTVSSSSRKRSRHTAAWKPTRTSESW